jgi:tetratricopeptide (TPR) repeat protein
LCRRTGNQGEAASRDQPGAAARLTNRIRWLEVLTIEALREDGKRREALDLTRAAIRRVQDDRGLRLTEVLILKRTEELQRGRRTVARHAHRARGTRRRGRERSLDPEQRTDAGRQLKKPKPTARKALELNPGDSDALLQLGSVLDRADKQTEAEGILRELLEREPDNATALNNLGYLLVEREQKLQKRRR